jgi:hypothetical protein
METVKMIVSKLSEELAFLPGIWNLHSVQTSQLKLGNKFICFVSILPYTSLIHSFIIYSLSQQIFTKSHQVSGTSLAVGAWTKHSPWEGIVNKQVSIRWWKIILWKRNPVNNIVRSYQSRKILLTNYLGWKLPKEQYMAIYGKNISGRGNSKWKDFQVKAFWQASGRPD